jgi:hypothetical protein
VRSPGSGRTLVGEGSLVGHGVQSQQGTAVKSRFPIILGLWHVISFLKLAYVVEVVALYQTSPETDFL